jgi:RimJ/RimL family protein N-acetyltransferase
VSHMPDEITLHTDRLLLRRWRPDDRAPFAAINADPRVMEWFQGPLTAAPPLVRHVLYRISKAAFHARDRVDPR